MAAIKSIKIGEQVYDVKAVYDGDGAVIKDTYATKTSLSEEIAKVVGAEADTDASDTIKGAKKYADAINTALDTRIDALETAVGEDGSVSGQIDDKIALLDVADTVVSTKYVSGVSETDGKIEVTRADLVAADNKVLGTNANGSLTATLGLTYDSTNKKIKLIGKGASDVLAQIDASAFIKDGMLNSAELVTNPEGQTAGTYIKLAFNTDSGKTPIFVNVTDLIDTYTAGNGLDLTSNKFSIKLASASEKYLEVTTAGIATKAIDDAISDAKTAATTEIAAKTTGFVRVAVDKTSGHNVYTLSDNDIASAAGLSAEITRAKAAEKTNADAIDAIKKGVKVENESLIINF